MPTITATASVFVLAMATAAIGFGGSDVVHTTASRPALVTAASLGDDILPDLDRLAGKDHPNEKGSAKKRDEERDEKKRTEKKRDDKRDRKSEADHGDRHDDSHGAES